MQNYRGFTNNPVYKVYHSNTNDIDIQFIFYQQKNLNLSLQEKKSNQCLQNPIKIWYFGK